MGRTSLLHRNVLNNIIIFPLHPTRYTSSYHDRYFRCYKYNSTRYWWRETPPRSRRLYRKSLPSYRPRHLVTVQSLRRNRPVTLLLVLVSRGRGLSEEIDTYYLTSDIDSSDVVSIICNPWGRDSVYSLYGPKTTDITSYQLTTYVIRH